MCQPRSAFHLPLLLVLSSCKCCGKDCDTGFDLPVCGGGLVISEIMFNPDACDDSKGEYLEVHNAGTSACTMEGLVVTREGTEDDFTIEESVVVAAGGYVVLAAGDPEAEGCGPCPIDYDWAGLSLTEEAEICLKTGSLATIDCVAYGGEGWENPDPGVSLTLDPDHLDADENDDPCHWCASDTDLGNGDLGSPGEAGTDCAECVYCPAEADLVISEVMPDPDAGEGDPVGEYIEVYNAGSEEMPVRCVRIYDDGVVVGEGRQAGCTEHRIPPGGYYVFARDAETLASLGSVSADAICELGIGLVNGGEVLGVGFVDVHDVETILDEVDCAGQACPFDAGVSMNLSADALDAVSNDDVASWCASSTPFGDPEQLGTPGSANEICETPPTCPSDADLVVVEIMPDPETSASEPAGEYLEVYNAGTSEVPVRCVRVYDAEPVIGGGLEPTCGEHSIPPGGYYVFAHDAVLLTSLGSVPADAICELSLALSNNGEVWGVGCLDEAGEETVLDEVDCAGQACPYDGGVSMNLSDDALDAVSNDDLRHWCASSTPFGTTDVQYGTPGSDNEACPSWPTLEAGDAFWAELMPRPTVPAADGEYIEATNASGVDIPLVHLLFLEAGSGRTLTCDGSTWAAGEALVIARNGIYDDNGGFYADCTASFSENDTGDTFTLQYDQPDGTTLELDTLTYADDWPFDSGVAMELTAGACFDATSNDGLACWVAATAPFGTAGQYGTPGTAP
ncbi:MAG: lamin tail domain-containing protein [Pseudomonadota bacterium]